MAHLSVVQLVVAGQVGGAERLLVDLASRPEASGADHAIALMTPNPKLRALFVDSGLRVLDRGNCPESPGAYLWRTYGPAELAWLAGRLRDEHADILHVHTFGSHTLGVRAAKRVGIPVIRTEHGPDHYSDWSCALFRRWTLRHTDRVIAVSDFVRRTIAAYDPPSASRTQTILNGVDLVRFAALPLHQAQQFTFSMTCRLEPVKQVHLAIEAVARVPGVRLNIAGDGSERPRLQALIERLGLADRVTLLGFQQDAVPAIAASHAAINCSRHEPMSLSILEAMAMGRPVVAFANGGTPEIIEDRISGWLVEPPNVAEIARYLALASSSRDTAARYGENARLRIEAKFSVDEMCNAYGRVYLSMLRRSGMR